MPVADLGSQPDLTVQIQRGVVQFSAQRGFDIQPEVSVQIPSLLAEPASRVQPRQKNGYFVRRRGSEYAQFDGQKCALELPFPTKLVYALGCVPYMGSFHQRRSLNFGNHGSDEV